MRPAGFNPSAVPDQNKFIVGIENYRSLLSTTYRKVTPRTWVHAGLILVAFPYAIYKAMDATTPGGNQILHDQMMPTRSRQAESAAFPPRAEVSNTSTPFTVNNVDAFGPETPFAAGESWGPYSALVNASRQYNRTGDRPRNWMPDPAHYFVRTLPAAPVSDYGAIARAARANLQAFATARDHLSDLRPGAGISIDIGGESKPAGPL